MYSVRRSRDGELTPKDSVVGVEHRPLVMVGRLMSSKTKLGIVDVVEAEDLSVGSGAGIDGLCVAVDKLCADLVLQQAVIHNKLPPHRPDTFTPSPSSLLSIATTDCTASNRRRPARTSASRRRSEHKFTLGRHGIKDND